MLERIQLLEDRLFSSPVFGQPATTPSHPPQSLVQPDPAEQLGGATSSSYLRDHHGDAMSTDAAETDKQIPIPLSHTANANHVLEWPIVQQLLSQTHSAPPPKPALGDMQSTEATDIFFTQDAHAAPSLCPPESWRLFNKQDFASSGAVGYYRELIQTYFDEVNIFFPLLSLDYVQRLFDAIVSFESSNDDQDDIAPALHCLVLLVLSFGSFVHDGRCRIRLAGSSTVTPLPSQDYSSLDDQLWRKAKLLLGYVSSDLTLEAAQCTMLASLYTGAMGRVSDSFHWAHATAVKCEALAKRVTADTTETGVFSESFRRLYWVAFIYEGDFISEVSITLPSGIARYEDVVPYPVQEAPSHARRPPSSSTAQHLSPSAAMAISPASSSLDRTEELVAFQISTNAAIRRFLNRVNSVVYDSKDQFRMTRANYANWLLRITEDLWSFHGAIYQNLPDFLLTSRPRKPTGSPATPGFPSVEELGNNPWNVLRLEGRYYAGQYIIHRPFIEYVLLNVSHFATHPCREAVLERCRLCLLGCKGFIHVFDVDPTNSVTGLFAAGMVTFTMVIILRVATMCPVFCDILPPEIERAIVVGGRNLRRFSGSVREFEWHLGVLEKLEESCRRQGGDE
ncbi:hypothetical protein D7B24_008133 [Verticillium nonalfalfae]|uniref:Transcription factor domain-containing protein n=1 Tax=Verticillium nonalfalfae TaxID=1051616 RepID=A0A3M9YKA7_9PEZI|nr:uncharacterized protein D7B24_008133 [Verticillium nonalfalfae]RNJ60441.1 hypothetical protein D7B24_008133 [Verticillium nonalfalfae]